MRYIPIDGPIPLPKRRKPRKKRIHAAPCRSERLYVYVDPSRVHIFRYLLEAEDNLALMTVVDRWRAALMIRFSPHQEGTVREHLEGMRQTLEFTILNRPGLASLDSGDATS